ncbi:hypothetical protein [Streptomyces sp. NPDC060243]|uniref:hypothetical protein n=1 Tax=Streptomyces sp. NPDC060243 TaxID=3347081 RepID=UPI0036631F12
MSTRIRRGRASSLRSRLLTLVHSATSTLTGAWQILTSAQERLLNGVARIRPGRGNTRALRTAVTVFQQSLAAFDRAVAGFAARWTATDLPLVYQEGGLSMLDIADRPYGLWSWTARHQARITGVSAQYYADLMGRLQEALRRARVFLRAVQDAARDMLAARIDVEGLRAGHRLGTVVYANNAHHPVEAWARASLSWQAVTTANQGAAQTALDELGCTHVEVRDGAGCGWTSHDDPDGADGTLRTIEDALAHPVAHPHCVRQLRPYIAPGGPT